MNYTSLVTLFFNLTSPNGGSDNPFSPSKGTDPAIDPFLVGFDSAFIKSGKTLSHFSK